MLTGNANQALPGLGDAVCDCLREFSIWESAKYREYSVIVKTGKFHCFVVQLRPCQNKEDDKPSCSKLLPLLPDDWLVQPCYDQCQTNSECYVHPDSLAAAHAQARRLADSIRKGETP